MNRNIKFEINYVLSLSIAILGLLSINGISEQFDERLGFLFIGALCIHLLIFNSYYLFNNILTTDFRWFSDFETPSRYSFYAISVLFAYLFSHLIISVLYEYTVNQRMHVSIISLFIELPNLPIGITSILQSSAGKTLMLYGAPVLGVLVLMAPLFALLPSMKFYNSVDVVVSPEEFEITDNFGDTMELSITVINNTDKEFDFNTAIELPSKVELQYDGERHTKSFETPISVSGTDPAEKITLDFRYTGDTYREVSLPIKFNHKLSSKTKTVNAELYPGDSPQ